MSLLGDQFMVVALPLLAVTTLGVSAAQAALLPFALKLPFLVLGLPAGAILDRLRRRPVLIACDSVQAVSYLAVALLAVAQRLPFWLLLLLIGINGCATVFFQITSTSYLPALLADPRSLQRGNIRLQLSESLSRSLGPALAGPLIAATGVASAVLANAGTFVILGADPAVMGAVVSVLGIVLIPVAGGVGLTPGLVAASVVHGVGEGAFGPTWSTLRQTITPAGLLGRVNSVERFLLWGAVPLGSLLASLSIRLTGLEGAMWIGALGTVLCLPPLLRRGVLASLTRPAGASIEKR